jgi:hypothetical protein
VDVERATRQLAVIGEVAGLAEELGIEIWLRGGSSILQHTVERPNSRQRVRSLYRLALAST